MVSAGPGAIAGLRRRKGFFAGPQDGCASLFELDPHFTVHGIVSPPLPVASSPLPPAPTTDHRPLTTLSAADHRTPTTSPAPFLIAIMGPTGSGKSGLAERLAERFDAQLLNADAFQVYRGMDVGTAKPAARDKYRLLDLKNPNESFGLGEFVRLAHAELVSLYEQRRNAIVVGGTGLYIRALFEEYGNMFEAADPALRTELETRLKLEGLESLAAELAEKAPETAAKLDLKNPVRVTRALEKLSSSGPKIRYELPNFVRAKFALLPPQHVLDVSLTTRNQVMVQNGWVQEVKRLLLEGYRPKDPGFRAIGYRELAQYVEGNVGLEEAMATTIAETRRYAKRQRTWIRSEPNVTLIYPDKADAYLEVESRIQSFSV